MPLFHVPFGLLFSVQSIEAQIKALFRADLVTAGPRQMILETDTYTYTLKGSGLAYDSADGILAAGTLTSVTASLTARTGYEMRFRDLDLDIPTLRRDLDQEESGANPAALETALYSLDWTLRANASAESFRDGDPSQDDAMPISLTGDNDVRLRFGADLFEAGDGNDTLRGGGSDDTLDGGAGRDVLYGKRGADVLQGGRGADYVDGGARADRLEGGRGRDTLLGAGGQDTLTGGAGADTFLFTDGGNADRITDFEPGRDRIEITSAGTPTLTDTPQGLVLELGLGGTILVAGISEAQLTPDDILLV